MVAMGRALMADPKILLMDEPSMGLAPILVEQVFEIIKKIRELGKTVFVVEQNANMALSIADRGYVIQTGQVVLSDTAENLLQNPLMRRRTWVSSELRVIGAEELRARLPMAAAVDALEDAFRTLDPAGGPLRTHVETPARFAVAHAGLRGGRRRREPPGRS